MTRKRASRTAWVARQIVRILAEARAPLAPWAICDRFGDLPATREELLAAMQGLLRRQVIVEADYTVDGFARYRLAPDGVHGTGDEGEATPPPDRPA